MNIYFDTEFTGLHKGTDLISIGLIDENGRTFYAEFNDYDKNQVNGWIEENVIKKLLFNDEVKFVKKSDNKNTTECKGNKKYIQKLLLEWLDDYQDVQFVSDVCHYDFVLLIDLLSFSALDLPKFICPVCIDINQFIARDYKITNQAAFYLSREQLAGVDHAEEKHNSLFDAKIIKAISEVLDF